MGTIGVGRADAPASTGTAKGLSTTRFAPSRKSVDGRTGYGDGRRQIALKRGDGEGR